MDKKGSEIGKPQINLKANLMAIVLKWHGFQLFFSSSNGLYQGKLIILANTL